MQELYVGNNQRVKANTLLAVIENPAKTEDILRLKELVGQADIITEDISLLERFLMPIRKVMTEGLESEAFM